MLTDTRGRTEEPTAFGTDVLPFRTAIAGQNTRRSGDLRLHVDFDAEHNELDLEI
jgi:hypothetical protein